MSTMNHIEDAIWEALEPRVEDAIRLDLNNPADNRTFGELVQQVAGAVAASISAEQATDVARVLHADDVARGRAHHDFEDMNAGAKEWYADNAAAVHAAGYRPRPDLYALARAIFEANKLDDEPGWDHYAEKGLIDTAMGGELAAAEAVLRLIG